MAEWRRRGESDHAPLETTRESEGESSRAHTLLQTDHRHRDCHVSSCLSSIAAAPLISNRAAFVRIYPPQLPATVASPTSVARGYARSLMARLMAARGGGGGGGSGGGGGGGAHVLLDTQVEQFA